MAVFDIINAILGITSGLGALQNQGRANDLFDDITNQRRLAREDPTLPAILNQELQRRADFLNGNSPLSGQLSLARDQMNQALNSTNQGANAAVSGLQALSGLQAPAIRGVDQPHSVPSVFGPNSAFESIPVDTNVSHVQPTPQNVSVFQDPNQFQNSASPFDFITHRPQPPKGDSGPAQLPVTTGQVTPNSLSPRPTAPGTPAQPSPPGSPATPQNPGRNPFGQLDPNTGLPMFEQGTPFVPRTGPAIVHQGEAIVPANQNPNNPGTGTPARRAPGLLSGPQGGASNPPAMRAPGSRQAPQIPAPPTGGGFQQQAPQAPIPPQVMQNRQLQGGINANQQPPVNSGQPFLTNSLEQMQSLATSGGPINQQVQNIQNQQVADLASQQQLTNQRAIRENFGGRGLGSSGLEQFMQLQNRLGSQNNVVQGQNQVALDAANRNFGAQLDASRNLNTGALGAEQLGLQRDQLSQAFDIANRGFGVTERGQDIQRMLGEQGFDVTRRGQDIQQTLGEQGFDVTRRGQDIQDFLGRGGLDLQGRGQDIQRMLGLEGIGVQREGLGVQERLGEQGFDVQRRGQDIQDFLGRRGQDIQETLGQRGIDAQLEQIRNQFELGGGRLDLDRFLGEGGLDLQQQGLDLNRDLGNRGLDIDQFRADTQRDLGTGDLNLRQDQTALDQFNTDRDFQRQSGLDQFGIQSAQAQQALDMISQVFGMDLANEQLSQDQLNQLLDVFQQTFGTDLFSQQAAA